MAMTPEERRRRERERKRAQRAKAREKPHLEALPQIGAKSSPKGGTGRGTDGGTDDGTRDTAPGTSVYLSTKAAVDAMDVPASAMPFVAVLLQLAVDLDSPGALPQRASLTQRYSELLDRIVAAAKPKEHDELDEMRRRFYTGGANANADRSASRSRKKA